MEQLLCELNIDLDSLSTTAKKCDYLKDNWVESSTGVCKSESNQDDFSDEEKITSLYNNNEIKQLDASAFNRFILNTPIFNTMGGESVSEEDNWTCKKLLGGGYLFRGFKQICDGSEVNGTIKKRTLSNFQCVEGKYLPNKNLIFYTDMCTLLNRITHEL